MSTLGERTGELLTLDPGDVTDGELSDLAQRLSTATAALAQLREVKEMLELELAARVDSDVTLVPGVGMLYRGYSRRSEWRDQHSSADLRRDVGEAVASKVSVDIGTGEIDHERRNIARATVEALYEVLPAFSSVKVPAKRYGIRLDDYRYYRDVVVVTIGGGEEEP